MSQTPLDKARQLIDKRKYDQARSLLQPLAFDNEEARALLEKLNTIAPPSATAPKKSGGCLSVILGGGLLTLGLLGACILGCVVIVVILAAGGQASQDKAEEANKGLGALDNPIPADTAVVFDDFTVTPLSLKMNASGEVERLNSFNEAPAAGTQYVLGEFKVECKKTGSEVCRGGEMKVRLVDETGAEWGEPTLIALGSDALDGKEAIGGNTIQGLVAFEFPDGKTITTIKLWQTGGATLYALPPSDLSE